MKRAMGIILSALLAVSAAPFAARAETVAVFDDFTVTLEKVSRGADRLEIRLLAEYESMAAAAVYRYASNGTQMTAAELEALYRDFYATQWARPTPETKRGVKVVCAAMTTPSGAHFPPEGSFSSAEFGTHGDPVARPDGTWACEVTYVVRDFATDEDGIWIAFYIFDTEGDAPFPSDPAQTMYVAF